MVSRKKRQDGVLEVKQERIPNPKIGVLGTLAQKEAWEGGNRKYSNPLR